jgi:hypothetical protein
MFVILWYSFESPFDVRSIERVRKVVGMALPAAFRVDKVSVKR